MNLSGFWKSLWSVQSEKAVAVPYAFLRVNQDSGICAGRYTKALTIEAADLDSLRAWSSNLFTGFEPCGRTRQGQLF